MHKKIFVLSQIPNLANLLRNEINQRAAAACGALDKRNATLLEGVDVVDVPLAGKGSELKFDPNLQLCDRDYRHLTAAQIVLVDNSIISQLFQAIDLNNRHQQSQEKQNGVDLRSIRWLQNTWAGVDSIFDGDDSKRRRFGEIIARNQLIVTRFSGTGMAQPMAEYILSHIISYERNYFSIHTMTKVHKQWRQFDWFDPIIYDCRALNELSAVVLGGTGAIGSYVCQKLSQMGMKVSAYGRRDRGRGDDWQRFGIAKYSTNLSDLLPDADYVISILPSTPATNDILGNDILSLCAEKKAVLINCGRGNVIHEGDIVKALDRSWLCYAILDVFEVEPLPEESPLWNRDDVLITPHLAANSKGNEIVKFFVDNYLKYRAGEPLDYVVNFEAGY